MLQLLRKTGITHHLLEDWCLFPLCPFIKEKNHEELRWGDYQLCNEGAQAMTPTSGSMSFGHPAFGGQHGGSQIASYSTTAEKDMNNAPTLGRLVSISAMPVYKGKNHEELRWEDYKLCNKGGFRLVSISAMPVYNKKTHEELRWEDYQLGDKGGYFHFVTGPVDQSTIGTSIATSTIQSNPSIPLHNSPLFYTSSVPSIIHPRSPASPCSSPFLFSLSSPPTLAFSSIFSSSSPPTRSLSSLCSSPSLLSLSSPPTFTFHSIFSSTFCNQTDSGFSFGLSIPTRSSMFQYIASSHALLEPISDSPPIQPNTFDTPLGRLQIEKNLVTTVPSQLLMSNPASSGQATPFFSTPFQPTQNDHITESSACGGVTGATNQIKTDQGHAAQSNAAVQLSPVTSPLGTSSATPHISSGCSGSSPSVQYGISSLPVSNEPALVRNSLPAIRHLSQRRCSIAAQKYDPKSDGPKVPFFSYDKGISSTHTLIYPRENPRAWLHSTERANSEKFYVLKLTSVNLYGNGEYNRGKEVASSLEPKIQPSGVQNGGSSLQNGDSQTKVSEHTGGEAVMISEYGDDVIALMPKRRRSDYYTEPTIQKLAAMEKVEPGFCSHVKDFVVGRIGYGSIKFLGETDVQQLDLDALVEFNNREVVVYMDEGKKPPIGQGLNKPAEVTLLNIRCIDKKTGTEHIDGPKVDKCKELLMKKAAEQGAGFVSFDPVEGECKFLVLHFSRYKFKDEN